MRRRLVEAFFAVVVEESLRAFLPHLLPYAWLAILALLTLELLNTEWCRERFIDVYSRWGWRNRLASYFLAGAVGAGLLCFYWWSIQKAFAVLAHEKLGTIAEEKRPNDHPPAEPPKTVPKEPPPTVPLKPHHYSPPKIESEPKPTQPGRHLQPIESLTDSQRYLLKRKLSQLAGKEVRLVHIGNDPHSEIIFEQLIDVFSDSGWNVQQIQIGTVGVTGVNFPNTSYLTSSDINNMTVRQVFSVFSSLGLDLPLVPDAFMGPMSLGSAEVVVVVH